MAFVGLYEEEGIALQKDSTRDYITAAFRLYAALGCPSAEEIEKSIFNKIDNAKQIEYKCAVIADLLAVINTLSALNDSGKKYICSAIEYIYFYEPKRKFFKGEINARVVAFSLENFTDERNVWRWLKEARELCAHFRGLNTATIEQLICD